MKISLIMLHTSVICESIVFEFTLHVFAIKIVFNLDLFTKLSCHLNFIICIMSVLFVCNRY